jgi:hypothetical protein
LVWETYANPSLDPQGTASGIISGHAATLEADIDEGKRRHAPRAKWSHLRDCLELLFDQPQKE